MKFAIDYQDTSGVARRDVITAESWEEVMNFTNEFLSKERITRIEVISKEKFNFKNQDDRERAIAAAWARAEDENKMLREQLAAKK